MRRRTPVPSGRCRQIRRPASARRFRPSVQGLEDRRLLNGSPAFLDPSFEVVAVEQYAYQPVSPEWSFENQGGVSINGTDFTGGNPDAPLGQKVAFIQQTGVVAQEVAGWDAGSYAISFRAAQRANLPGTQTIQIEVDGDVVGTFTPSGMTYQPYTTNSFQVASGDHTVRFVGLETDDATAFIDDLAIQVALPSAEDSGFEAASVPTYEYGPSGSSWLFAGPSGLSANGSDFTAGNPAAPEGAQVAFLQGDGTISQSIDQWKEGWYAISLRAAQRENFPDNLQSFEVQVDGDVVASFTPSGTDYQPLTTPAFNVADGSHVVSIVGLDPTQTHTVFLDELTIFAAPAAPEVGDFGFETVPTATFAYGPEGSAWTFGGTSGLSGNGSDFTSGNPDAPQGEQVAFLQSTGVASQSIDAWRAGAYSLSFQAAQRQNFQEAPQTIEVRVDGAVVAIVTPTGSDYQPFVATFDVSEGTHVVALAGTATQDGTAFIDDVVLQAAAPVFADSGFEQIETPTYEYGPSGSPWIFYRSAGISADGSGFTSDNPDAPQGAQVAFLQDQGSMEQTIAGWQAGYYALSFKAAQRDDPDNLQSFGVMVDGDILGTFTPSGTDYETIVTNAFYAVAGYHTFRIYGLNATDDTVFLDDFRLVPVLGDGFNAPLGSASTITLDATVRDFTADHPDFQVDADPFVVPGLVAPDLGEDGKPVFVGPDGGGGITDASTFAQWYEQVDGVNESTTLSLTLTETSPGSGVYEYATSHFFPIDGQLLGNEGDAYRDPFGIPHNFHFTTQVSTQFTYLGGETYNFWSDDDLWVFIDGKLVVDLGGLHPGASQSVSLDSLGLGIGQTYSFDLFYAERHDYGANFRMQVGTEVV